MKNKGSSKLIFSLIIGFIIILGIGALISFSIPQSGVGDCSGSASILSVDKLGMFSSSNLGGKEAIRVTALANGGSECLVINWGSDELEKELEDATGESFNIEDGFKGNILLTEQTQTFFSKTSSFDKFVNKLQVVDVKGSGVVKSCNKVCNNAKSNVIGYTPITAFGSQSCTCLRYYEGGKFIEFQDSYDFDFKVKVDIDGAGSDTLSKSKQSVKLGEKVYVKYTSSEMSGFSWQDRVDEDLFMDDNFNWRMVEEDAYENIREKWLNDWAGKDFNAYKFPSDGEVETYNKFVNSQTSNQLSTYISGERLVEDAEIKGNDLEVEIKTGAVSFPKFTIDIEAEWVGIFKEEGQPEVKCPKGRQDIDTKEQYSDLYQVRDTVGNTPSFGLSLECEDINGYLSQSRIVNVGTSYENVVALISINDKDKAECTFTAYDLNEPDNKDSCTREYEGVVSGACEDGDSICSVDGESVGTCKDGEYAFEECKFGCINGKCSDELVEICNDGIDNDKDGLIDYDDTDDCKRPTPNIWERIKEWFNGFRWAFALALGTLSAIFGGMLFHKVKTLLEFNTPLYLTFIVGFVIGALIGFLAYSLFWVALGLMAIVLIVRLIL